MKIDSHFVPIIKTRSHSKSSVKIHSKVRFIDTLLIFSDLSHYYSFSFKWRKSSLIFFKCFLSFTHYRFYKIIISYLPAFMDSYVCFFFFFNLPRTVNWCSLQMMMWWRCWGTASCRPLEAGHVGLEAGHGNIFFSVPQCCC